MQTRPRILASQISIVALAAVAGLLAVPARPALAQAIVMSINGDPVTSVDMEAQAKLQRALHKPTSREAVTESLIEDHLKYREAARFGINIKDNEIGEEVQAVAKTMKMSPQALLMNIQKSGASPEAMRYHFKAQFAYSILIRALNKGVEASEVAVRGELAKEKTKGGETSYTIRQVVFTLNPTDPPSLVEASVKQAQALRGRFTSCDSGISYAKNLPGVAVRSKLTRNASQLSDGIKEMLDKLPVGHLSEPSRSANGIEMVALCDRSLDKSDDTLRKSISDRLMALHFDREEARKYQELRKTAVINKSP